ncbi:hypothetical protein COCSUDRAFT_39894 [Coccomyxa subellipsoidea C-169]|uniref:Uncharacterized protein n=1 Tax=Coccomyxa subellipsoidea (strain C-169) TaxID=574566 RepID=I0Z8H9_COCSC|nr:hypothetical protein COCSUDRAFT_39894 [Coccomyxa subellipsoidea C-169]EIE26948.1 hypothetical protein COCSUDRAFT_39894 [Coccomyxa subellipsoidea C-169]|eukprot:XP_005651492.1 hypothetical protein COCSUDRAFT_39894 [Coccomyxa subellipsoidea C-169]
MEGAFLAWSPLCILGLVVGGLVDLLGTKVQLPPGTEQVFLTLAFGAEAFLMSSHKKHEALDATVHGLLALTMWACTLCTLGELFARHSMLATAGRTLSCLMQGMWLIQGIWLIQIGQIMHTTPLPWRTDESVAGIMLAPVLFAMLTLLCAVILLALYLILQAWHNRSPSQHSRLPLSDSLAEINFPDMIHSGGDSAHENSDSSGSESEGRLAGQPKPGRRQQLRKAFQLLSPIHEPKDKGGHLV